MGGDVPKPFPDLEPDKNSQPDKDVKPTDEIKPKIKPEPEQFDNNTPHTKEEWFKSKWKTEKYTHNINGHGITFCIFFFLEKKFQTFESIQKTNSYIYKYKI